MMEFCTNCGSEVTGLDFCPECGTKVERGTEAPVVEGMAPETSAVNGNLVKIIIAAVIAVVVIVAGFMIFGGGNNPEGVAEDAVKAVLKFDAKKIVSLMPKDVVNYVVEEEYDDDKKEMIEDLQDELDDMKEELEDEEIKISKIKYEVKDTDKMKKDDIERYEDLYDDADLKIKEGKYVEIEITMPDPEDDDEEIENTINLPVVKVGGKWCVLSVDALF